MEGQIDAKNSFPPEPRILPIHISGALYQGQSHLFGEGVQLLALNGSCTKCARAITIVTGIVDSSKH